MTDCKTGQNHDECEPAAKAMPPSKRDHLPPVPTLMDRKWYRDRVHVIDAQCSLSRIEARIGVLNTIISTLLVISQRLLSCTVFCGHSSVALDKFGNSSTFQDNGCNFPSFCLKKDPFPT